MQKLVEDIVSTLNRIGFDGERHRELVAEKVKYRKPSIDLPEFILKEDGNSVLVEARFDIDPIISKYRMAGYRMHVEQALSFPDVVVNGVSVKALHDRMDAVNWGTDFKDAYQHWYNDYIETQIITSPILDILKDLWKLAINDDPAGTELQGKLMFKFLLDTPFENYNDLSHIRNRYSAERTYTQEYMPKLDKAYKDLVQQMSRRIDVPRRHRQRAAPTPSRGQRPG